MFVVKFQDKMKMRMEIKQNGKIIIRKRFGKKIGYRKEVRKKNER